MVPNLFCQYFWRAIFVILRIRISRQWWWWIWYQILKTPKMLFFILEQEYPLVACKELTWIIGYSCVIMIRDGCRISEYGGQNNGKFILNLTTFSDIFLVVRVNQPLKWLTVTYEFLRTQTIICFFAYIMKTLFSFFNQVKWSTNTFL